MVLIRVTKLWQLSERQVTSAAAYFNRRRFLKALIGTGTGMSLSSLAGCITQNSVSNNPLDGTKQLNNTRNPNFAQVDRRITNRLLASTYNNFYEFGNSKDVWQSAQTLPVESWKVEVTGLIKNSRTYDIDDLRKSFPLEERIYRFRCVEAWSMVLPWIGFPMRTLIEAVEPMSTAKFVCFTSYYDSTITKGPGLYSSFLPWPYTEALRIDEMANELAFFAVGIYGQTLPKQHGAPIRAVLPWKYGFKGAKSIVKIEFTETEPATFWNTLNPKEYKFEANVEPMVPHPRWSQKTERFVGDTSKFSWEERPTLLYNGYEEYVANLYA